MPSSAGHFDCARPNSDETGENVTHRHPCTSTGQLAQFKGLATIAPPALRMGTPSLEAMPTGQPRDPRW